MKIGIIGSGNIGGTLTRRFREVGHEVSVANSRGPESLAELAQATGAHAVTVAEAARGKDIVIVTIPMRAIVDLPKDLFAQTAATTVIVDTGNYYPRERDGRIEEIEAGLTESGWVAQQLGRPVIKAFNNIYAQHLLELGKPAGAPDRIALPVSGDDASAKGTLMRLIDEIGFDSVDVGLLLESWRQQPGTTVYGTDFDRDRLKLALEEERPGRQPQWSGSAESPGSFEAPR